MAIMADVLFPTSVIGSLPRPQFVKDLIADDCPIRGDEYRRLMGDAIRAAVALQETAGLDVITDGEWWRKSYIGVIAELAHGFELSRNPADGRPWTVVVDKLSPKQPGFIAKEVAFLKQLTKRKSRRPCRPRRCWASGCGTRRNRQRRIPKREDFVRDCVPILRREVELLRDEGVSIVQIDDPHLCLFVDPQVRSQYDDAERASDFAVDMDNQVVDGINGVKLAVHLCRRAGARARGEADHRGGYDPILRQLGRLKVDHITMEFTSPGAGDMSVFKRLPEDVEIGLGCVSCQPGQIDSAETIVEPRRDGLEARGPGADHAQPRLRLRPRLGRRSEPRRGVHEAEERSRRGTPLA